MPHNEEGEFELVLGNKELLSVLFIVVVLLGIFFAMGYVVGRNSTPVDAARKSETYERTDAPSAMPERRPQQQTPAPKLEEPAAATAHAAEQPSPTQPQNPTAAAPASAKTIEIGPVSTAEPQAGQTFLQVSAVAKAEAEILTELLVKKGFRAVVAPGPTDKLFRVLVGPTKDNAELGKIKGELELAGFKSIIRKY